MLFNPVIGSDIDRGIHTKAGHELLVARQKLAALSSVMRLSLGVEICV